MGLSKRLRFGPPTGEGVPQGFEGLGSWIVGVKGESPPCRFGQSPRVFRYAKAWLGEAKKRRRPLSILMR
ncbi:hypothetical protein CN354_21320 [Bacillus cereus]|nr:hypothetical protein CN354_21320 [Bacillus cereus]